MKMRGLFRGLLFALLFFMMGFFAGMGIFSRDYERIEGEESRYSETTVVEENPGEIIIEIPDDGQEIRTPSDEAESETGLTPEEEDTEESETETQEETEEYENTEDIPAEPYIPPELIASPGDAVPMNAISTGEYRPGGVVSRSIVDGLGADSWFSKWVISDSIFQRMYGKSYGTNCTMPREDLRYLRILYIGFDQNIHVGELVCHKDISDDLLWIFRRLYEAKYQIEKVVLVDDYGGDDDLSSSANNTSCFNFRTVAGSHLLSHHSEGKAIDVNPKYNPYVTTDADGNVSCAPKNGSSYADRDKNFAHKIDESDLCYQLFTAAGFTWGGAWANPDYMHFSK